MDRSHTGGRIWDLEIIGTECDEHQIGIVVGDVLAELFAPGPGRNVTRRLVFQDTAHAGRLQLAVEIQTQCARERIADVEYRGATR